MKNKSFTIQTTKVEKAKLATAKSQSKMLNSHKRQEFIGKLLDHMPSWGGLTIIVPSAKLHAKILGIGDINPNSPGKLFKMKI